MEPGLHRSQIITGQVQRAARPIVTFRTRPPHVPYAHAPLVCAHGARPIAFLLGLIACLCSTLGLAAEVPQDVAPGEAPPDLVPTPATKPLGEVGVVSAKSGFRVFDQHQFGIGIYNETPTKRTADLYRQEGLGFSLSYDQWVRSGWSGGLQLKIGSWELTDAGRERYSRENRTLDLASPWSIGTRVQFNPDLFSLLTGSSGVSLVHTYFRPLAGFGLGFASFFDSRGFLAKKSKNETSEPFLNLSLGARFLWPKNLAIRIAHEWWRGVRTFNYTSEMWTLEVQFGDIDAI